MPEETSPHPLLGAQDQRLGAEQDQPPCGSTEASSGNCRETGNLHGPSVSHATTASPKPSLRVGDALVGKGNAGWTTSQGGHIHPCQNYLQGPPAEKTERGFPLNRPSCPPDDPNEQHFISWLPVSMLGVPVSVCCAAVRAAMRIFDRGLSRSTAVKRGWSSGDEILLQLELTCEANGIAATAEQS